MIGKLLVCYLILGTLVSFIDATVQSCYVGTSTSGSSLTYPSPVKKNCTDLNQLNQACWKAYASNSGVSASVYSCGSSEGCGLTLTLSGVTSTLYCCYTDNCNEASTVNDSRKIIWILLINLAIYSLF